MANWGKWKEEQYRPNVAAVILNPEGRILICHRGLPDRNDWQLPQGGIEPGESPEQAILREIREETGLTGVRIIGRARNWVTYTWPPESRRGPEDFVGQKQIYFVLRLTEDSPEMPSATASFRRFDWVEWEEVLRRAHSIKRAVYSAAFVEIKGIIATASA